MEILKYDTEITALLVIDPYNDFISGEGNAALDINIPNYATAIVTTDEVVELISRDALQ